LFLDEAEIPTVKVANAVCGVGLSKTN